jgi:hypothetical protein
MQETFALRFPVGVEWQEADNRRYSWIHGIREDLKDVFQMMLDDIMREYYSLDAVYDTIMEWKRSGPDPPLERLQQWLPRADRLPPKHPNAPRYVSPPRGFPPAEPHSGNLPSNSAHSEQRNSNASSPRRATSPASTLPAAALSADSSANSGNSNSDAAPNGSGNVQTSTGIWNSVFVACRRSTTRRCATRRNTTEPRSRHAKDGFVVLIPACDGVGSKQ